MVCFITELLKQRGMGAAESLDEQTSAQAWWQEHFVWKEDSEGLKVFFSVFYLPNMAGQWND